MLRVIRVMRFFRELRLLLGMLLHSVGTFLWTVVMLMIVLYVFGVIFLQGYQGYLASPDMYNAVHDEDLRKYWGSIWSAMLTLYSAITGGYDWNDIARPLEAL